MRLLNWLAHENARLFREYPDLPGVYESGVEYRREAQEDWADWWHVLQQGWDDCDALAAARAGELLARGWRAIPRGYSSWGLAQRLRPASIHAEVEVRTEVPLGSTGLYHCIVRYRVGDRWFWDDPSARLGMFPRRFTPRETETYLAEQYTPPATRGVPMRDRFRPITRFRPARRLDVDEAYGARPRGGSGGPEKVVDGRLRVQARPGHRAAVLELRPGLYILADVPEQTLRGMAGWDEGEVGLAPVLVPLIVSSAAQALHHARQAAPSEDRRPLLQLPGPRRVIEVPEWVDEQAAGDVGCACQRGRK